MNQKTLTFLLILLVCHVFFSGTALASRTVRVAVHETKPLAFTGEGGEIKGIFPELLSEIARLADWDIEITVVKWTEGLKMAEKGQVDLLGPIGFVQKRLSRFTYNKETVIVDWGQVYSRSDLQLTSIFDLAGKKIAIQDGHIMMSTLKDLLDRFDISAQLIPAKDQKTLFQMVASKQVDACAVNRLFGLLNESDFKIHRSPIVYHPVEIKFAGPKQGREAVFAELDSHLAKLKLDKHSAYHHILDQWLFGSELKGWNFSLQQMISTAAVVGGALVLLFGWTWLLRVQVRKRTKALSESELRFRQLVENINEVFWIGSTGWDRIDYISPSYESVWGRSCESLYSKPRSWLATVADQDRQSVKQYIKEKQKGDLDHLVFPEYRIHRPDGTLRWISARGYPIRDPDGTIVRIAGIAEDITERKLYEERLRESESQFRTLIESTSAVAWQFDLEKNRWIYVAPQAETLFGFAPHEWTDFGFWENRLHPQDREPISQARRTMTAQGRDHVLEYRAISESGETIWIRDIVEVHAKNDQPWMLRGFMFDISDRKRVEEEKEKFQAQFLQAQKMESVGRLAGGVAHDFNNMLSIILGNTEMLLEDIPPDSRLTHKLDEIFKAAEHSANLTRQLLAFARKQTIAPKVLDLNKTVAGMIKMLQRLIGEDIDLMWQPGDNVWPVKIDPSQIDQVLANLCVNARDAIKDVGKVTIETNNTAFDEAYCADHLGFIPGEYVFLAISDNGCGMDAETLDNIFEPFFTTKESGQGTGLGLATVYGVAKQNNGFVNVYSEPGQGTTFNLYFPRYKTKVGALPEKSGRRPIERGHETILLVEDEISILQMTAQMLERLGYQVVSAKTPGEAIRLAQEYTGEIHLLMTDVVMPEMNGRDLAKNILYIHPNLKRLFMSGYTANVIAHHGVLDEGVNFIQKPFSMEQIGEKVREALDKDKL